MEKSTNINFELLHQMFEDELYQALMDEIDKLLDEELTQYEQMRLELMLSGIFVAQTNFKRALDYNLRALAWADTLDEVYYLALAECNCISIFSRLNEPEQAIYYGEKALGNYIKIDDREQIGKTYGKLGTVYEAINQLDEARVCFEKALEYADYLEDTYHVTIVLNLAVIDIYDKNFVKVLNVAITYIPKVEELNNFRLLSFIYRLKGIAHYGLEQYEESRIAFEFVEPFHQYLKNYFEQIEWYKYLSEIAKTNGNLDHVKQLSQKIEMLQEKLSE